MTSSHQKTIIYVSDNMFSEEWYSVVGAKYLSEKGYNVEIWYVNPLGIPDRLNTYDKYLPSDKVVHFTSYRRYQKRVKRVRDSLFCVDRGIPPYVLYPICKYKKDYFVHGERSSWPGHWHFSQSQLKYEEKKNNRQSSVLDKIRKDGFTYWFENACKIMVYKLISSPNNRYKKIHSQYVIDKHKPKVIFVTNQYTWDNMVSSLTHWKECEKSFVPSRTYNIFLQEERKANHCAEEFILFAVGGIGFKNIGLTREALAERIYEREYNLEYRRQIEYMLDKLEIYYGLPVIIAAHPRGDYGDYTFGGRKIVFGRTPELTKKCKIFIGNASMSIAYPLLWDKEVLMYSNNVMNQSVVWRTHGSQIAKELGINYVNMSDTNEINMPWTYVSRISETRRIEYINRHVKDVSADKRLYEEILLEWIDCFMKEKRL